MSALELPTLDARATSSGTRMGHILSLDPTKNLCGRQRPNPGSPPDGWGFGSIDCVVCIDLWHGLPSGIQDAIIDAALRAERAA